VVLVSGVLLRVVHLDADPDYYGWTGYITDEGRWIAHARELSLFGRLINGDELAHLLVAPLFQALSYGVFRVLGVSFWTARLLPAVSGGAILIVFWLMLRRVVSPAALLVALALLAFDVDFLMLSRVAVPEVPAMLLELLVYAIIVTGRPAPFRMFAGGLLLLATLAMKATTLPLLVIFSVIVLVQRTDGPGDRHRWRRLSFFLAGVGVCLVLAAPIALPMFWRHASALVETAGVVGTLFRLSGLYAYMSFPFESDFAAAFNVFGLGVCFAIVGWLTRGPDPVEPRLARYFVTSAVWYAMYAVMMLSTAYFPERYKVHILVPMAIGIASGLSVLERGGVSAIREALARMAPARRLLTLALLALPSAALWAPALADLGSYVGADRTRLRLKLVCVGLGLVGAVGALHRRSRREVVGLRFCIIFPVVGLLAGLLGIRAGVLGGFWAEVAGPGIGGWTVGVAVATGVSGVLARLGRAWEGPSWRALIPVAALGCAALNMARVAPSYAHPHYSMKVSSEQLASLFAGSSADIATFEAEGLFNGNALPYRSLFGLTWPAWRPEGMVIAFGFDDPEQILRRDYTLIATYRISVSTEYTNPHELSLDPRAHEELVKVYRRNDGG